MRTTMAILLLLSAGWAPLAGAQAGGTETRTGLREEQIAEIVTQRESIIARNLSLTADQGAAFWKLYRKYRAERDAVNERATKLTTDFERNFDNLTEEFARKYTAGMLEIQRDDLAAKTKYLRAFEKVLTPTKAAKFYQIENKLDATLNFNRAQKVPLMR